MIHLVDDYKHFVGLKGDWNALLDQSANRDNVFLRHEWFDVWWQSFGEGKHLFILLGFDSNRLIGIAPFMLFRDRYKGVPYTRLNFIEDANAPEMNLIAAKGREEEFTRLVFNFLFCRCSVKWDVAVLNKIRDGSIFDNENTLSVSGNKISYLRRESQNSPYICTEGNWEDFINTTSQKFRKQLRNKFNRLNKQGTMMVDVFHEAGRNGEYLGEAFSVSSRSWKHDLGTSMVSTPERRKFFELLSDVAARNGWLRIWFLKLNGFAVAMEYHLEYNGRTHAMRGDFDKFFCEMAPGSVLEAEIIKYCFENKLLEYDFCGLPFDYKLRWTSLVHSRSNYLVYNNTIYGVFMHRLQKHLPYIGRAAGRLKSFYSKAGFPRQFDK